MLTVAGALVAGFGYLAIFTIGLPIVVMGLLILVAGLTDAHRQHPTTFWPVTVGLAAFFAGAIIIAPLSCTSRAVAIEDAEAPAAGDPSSRASMGTTECTNLVGIDYTGGPDYNPPLWPALLAGAASGVLLGTVTRCLMRDPRKATT